MSLHFNSLSGSRRRLLTLSTLAGFAGAAQAAPYTAGDLLLGFVAGGGTGSDQTLVVNLGLAAGFRDAFDAGTNKLNFANIGSQLAIQFGADWYDHAADGGPDGQPIPDLYVSLFGTTSASATLRTLYNGDPARTLYVSQARSTPGTPGQADSPGWTIQGSSDMTGSASIMVNVSVRYSNSNADAQTVAVIPDSEANTLDEYTRPVTGNSFLNFGGGIEQIPGIGSFGTVGDAGAVEVALDLYRLQARSDIAGQYVQTAANGEGVYKGTITISQSGAVSFIARGNAPPADGFNTWAVSKGLPSGVAADDDRDNDGIPALTEYALDLNPLAFDSLPAPVAVTGGLEFTFTKGAAAAADTKISYQVESSSTFNADWALITPTVNDASKISALLPAGSPSGRLFGRLKVTQAD